MGLVLVFFPIVMAGLAAVFPSQKLRPWFLPLTSLLQCILAFWLIFFAPDQASLGTWLALDSPAKVVLLTVSGLFLFVSFYAAGYLRYRLERSNRVFVSSLLIFLGLSALVVLARHLGLLWVAIEGTTLATAPLIFFNRSKESLEATWKYLLVLSVGIALALLGTFFLAYSAFAAGLPATLNLSTLIAEAPRLSKPWLGAGFLLLLVGYGTKMGLAPMHTWKPDAYGEAPGMAGALFAGGVTSLAFLAILRAFVVVNAAGESGHFTGILLAVGLFSMAIAGLFLVGQKDLKRMLAYSSVEHMGILLFGLGVGGGALWGTFLHILTNGSTKGVLFLTAGNIHRSYGSKKIDVVRGVLRRLPLTGSIFLAGFLAITGSPPFGPFVSEFSILNGALGQGLLVPAVLFLLFLFVVFVGMGKTVLTALQGQAPQEQHSPYRESFLTAGVPLVLLLVVLGLGVFLPGPLQTLLTDAARSFEVHP